MVEEDLVHVSAAGCKRADGGGCEEELVAAALLQDVSGRLVVGVRRSWWQLQDISGRLDEC